MYARSNNVHPVFKHPQASLVPKPCAHFLNTAHKLDTSKIKGLLDPSNNWTFIHEASPIKSRAYVLGTPRALSPRMHTRTQKLHKALETSEALNPPIPFAEFLRSQGKEISLPDPLVDYVNISYWEDMHLKLTGKKLNGYNFTHDHFALVESMGSSVGITFASLAFAFQPCNFYANPIDEASFSDCN